LEPTNADPAEPASLASLIGRIVAELKNNSSTGDIAELRRLDPDHPGAPPFWRIVVIMLDSSLPSHGNSRTEAIRRWSVILRTLAQMAGLHDSRQPLGTGAAEAGVSETRMLKLLRASGGILFDSIRMIAHQLASKGVAVNLADFARLVLSDGRADESEARDRVAYDFYAHLHRIEKGGSR
jgi:hypothetical protein